MTNKSNSAVCQSHPSQLASHFCYPESFQLYIHPDPPPPSPLPKRICCVTETFILGKYFNVVNKSIYLFHICLNKFMLIG